MTGPRAGRVRVGLHVDQLWFSAPGGIGTYVRALLQALPALDEAPEVVPFHATWPVPVPELAAVHTVEVPGSIVRLYPAWNLAGRPPLPETLAGCDVIHATNHAAVPPAPSGRGLVVTVHDLAFERFPSLFPPRWRLLYRAGLRATLRRADLMLAPSQATADDLLAHGADPDRIRVTPLASSLPPGAADVDEVLARLRIPRPYVLCPATLEPRKNHVRLLRAFRQVAPDVPHALVLAGPDGAARPDIEAELARPGHGTVVRTGPLDPEDLDAVERGADAIAYVSLYEGFGLPVIEAFQRGIPVVASTTPAVAETAGDAAVLVDPEDVAAIAEGLAAALTDEELRATLSARGRERAAGFSWERTARATLDAYRDAAARAASH
ncbi:MAG: glycosyltransferase family 4 protein [Actinomycetota bacterium]